MLKKVHGERGFTLFSPFPERIHAGEEAVAPFPVVTELEERRAAAKGHFGTVNYGIFFRE